MRPPSEALASAPDPGKYLRIERFAARLGSLGFVAVAFVAGTVLLYLPYVAYEAWLNQADTAQPLKELPAALRAFPLLFWFVDFVIFTGCFGALCSIAVLWASRQAERRKRRIEAENLQLRLALEQQRLASLVAQLEPHFLFNALNAITGLVRTQDGAAAVAALGRLSTLLRYVLESTRHDLRPLIDEIDFIDGYLALQRLRYGERLRVQIDADLDALADAWTPPLLLQPLVENALRHDLDRHDGPGDIRLKVAVEAGRILFVISNPLRAAAAPNPGLGLGLANTRHRLDLLYGPQGRVEAGEAEGRFRVVMQLPACPDE